MSPTSNKMFTALGILQSSLALLALLVSTVVFGFSTDIDADKPTHQVSLASRLGETAVLCGLPVLWLTLAAILIWRKKELGWWLCVLGDLCVVGLGLLLLADDLSRIADLGRHPALYDDVFYHLILVLIPSAGLVLLFTRSIRAYSSAFLRRESSTASTK